jgi:hypothetical protein
VVFETQAHTGANGETIIQTALQLKESAIQSPDAMSLIAEMSSNKDGFKFKQVEQTNANCIV